MRPSNYLKVLNFISKHTNPFLEKEILDITTTNLKDENKEEWADNFAKIEPTSRMNLVRQLVAAGTYEFPKQKPRTEILLLSGAQDQLVNPSCTDRIGEMWTLKPHVNPKAGHDIPLEDPQWVCDQIRQWLGTMDLL